VNILFITSNRVGDAVLTTGVYGRLAEIHNTAAFTVACGPLAAPLFASAPQLERLIVLAKRPWAGHWRDLWRQTVTRRWDLIVDLRDSAVSRLVPADRRLIMRPAPKNAPPLHKVTALARLIGADPPPPPRLWLSAAAQEEAARLLGPAGQGGRPLLALAPTANWTAKEWPAERFAEVARRLTAPGAPSAGAQVMVAAAPSEADRARRLVAALPAETVIDLIGRTGDAATAAAGLARADLFIGNDSGLMHLAAAAGVPTLGLFGPGFPEIYGPWGPRAAVVVSKTAGEALRARVTKADKAPAGLMDGIDVDMVTDAATALLLRCR
jgi:ADP-heptose:LPS heptosyltransferase